MKSAIREYFTHSFPSWGCSCQLLAKDELQLICQAFLMRRKAQETESVQNGTSHASWTIPMGSTPWGAVEGKL